MTAAQRAAVLVKGGNGKTDELTFEQPEEIALRKSKTGRRRRYTEFERTQFFCANESGTAGEFISRLSKKFERRDFFICRINRQKIISDKTGGTEK